MADFLKLTIYASFFFVILTFYGLPIHILRDLFMTTRSFLKQLTALLRYRQAVRDMSKYPDATEEELGRENTCIICREEMHLWNPNDGTQIERYRPKKLPCGHILHFGCLKSWLERQQVCPTCRRSVMPEAAPAQRNRDAVVIRIGLNQQNQNPAPNGAAPGGGQGGQNNPQQPPNGGNGVRMFNLGPLRLGFAQGGAGDLNQMAQRLGMPVDIANPAVPVNAVNNPPVAQGVTGGATSVEAIHQQLRDIEQRIQRESASLQFSEMEANTLRLLLTELTRIRHMQAAAAAVPAGMPTHFPPQAQGINAQVQAMAQQAHGMAAQLPLPGLPFQPQFIHQAQQTPLPGQNGGPIVAPYGQPVGAFAPRLSSPAMRLMADPNTPAIPAGHPDLPNGVTIPAGWSLLPLQRADVNAPPTTGGGRSPTPDVHALFQQHQTATSAIAAAMANASRNGTPGPQSDAVRQPPSSHPAAPRAAPTSEPAPIVQPTPVLPNWGGAAQHFGTPFGYRVGTPSGAQEEAQTPSSAAPPAATAPDIGPSSSTAAEASHEGHKDEGDNKGKARAATVEEAADDEDGARPQ
jgi:E3 ubiquitin-protein ligase synoviolin